jgi:hypothetical protein
MKKIGILIICCLYVQAIFAQQVNLVEKKSSGKNKCIKKGNLTIGFGYGAPSILRTFLREKTPRVEFDVYGIGPFIFKTDYFINKRWSIGVNFTYSKSYATWIGNGLDTVDLKEKDFKYVVRAQEFTYTIRSNYHFAIHEKYDFYTGFGIGNGKLKFNSYAEPARLVFDGKYNFPNPMAFEATIGAMYFPFKNIGLYSEIGLGKLWIVEFFDKNYFIPDAIFQTGVKIKL